MSAGDLYRSIEDAANFRNDEVVRRALNARPRWGRPPEGHCYSWEDDVFGNLDPALFFSTRHGHPEWWEKLWEQHVWLDRPNVWFTNYEVRPEFPSYEQPMLQPGSERPGYGILAFDSPPSFRKTWYEMQEDRTDGLLFYGCTTDLEGALMSNPKLRQLAVRWRRRHAG